MNKTSAVVDSDSFNFEALSAAFFLVISS